MITLSNIVYTSYDNKMLGRLRKSNKVHSHGQGMTNGSIKSMTMTRASFYTHFVDMRMGSKTYGKRVSRDAL